MIARAVSSQAKVNSLTEALIRKTLAKANITPQDLCDLLNPFLPQDQASRSPLTISNNYGVQVIHNLTGLHFCVTNGHCAQVLTLPNSPARPQFKGFIGSAYEGRRNTLNPLKAEPWDIRSLRPQDHYPNFDKLLGLDLSLLKRIESQLPELDMASDGEADDEALLPLGPPKHRAWFAPHYLSAIIKATDVMAQLLGSPQGDSSDTEILMDQGLNPIAVFKANQGLQTFFLASIDVSIAAKQKRSVTKAKGTKA